MHVDFSKLEGRFETLTGFKGFLGTQKQRACSIKQHTFKNDWLYTIRSL